MGRDTTTNNVSPVRGVKKMGEITSPLRFAVSGDVPAHSWVSAPCGVGYNSMLIRIWLNQSREPVDYKSAVETVKQLKPSLSRLK